MKKKQISMVVTVSVPEWLTAAQARKEVRSLIKDQAFWGHNGGRLGYDEISEYNFKVKGVVPVGQFVNRL